MSFNTLCISLLKKQSFQTAMHEVIRLGVLDEFPVVQRTTGVQQINWEKLLLCASLLAKGTDPETGQKAALRIADTILKLKSFDEHHRDAAAIIFHMMANTRSLDLAEGRHYVETGVASRISFPLVLDFVKREEQYCIRTRGTTKSEIPVNAFQLEFWNQLLSGGWVSASAPTSAGKSFLLKSWVFEYFSLKPSAKVAFLVPTRALIQEIADGFMQDQANGLLSDVEISTLPLGTDLNSGKGALCVYTQERMHILLGREKTTKFDLVIVDEAQKVGDGYRGVLLEQVVAEIVRREPAVQVVFASPFSNNPDILKQAMSV